MRARALLALAALATSSVAHGQEPDSPPAGRTAADAKTEAQELIRAGVELRRQGREAEALEQFRSANARFPSPRALGQMGLAAKSLRLYVEAERCIDGALAAGDDPWVQQNTDALELARVFVEKQLASLVVRSNVDGAELFVNGNAVGRLPLAGPVRVAAGAVRLEVRAPGYAPAQTEQTLAAGLTAEAQLELRRVDPAPTPPTRASPIPQPDRNARAASAGTSRVPYIVAAAVVGVLGLAAGSYFGVRTLSEKDARDREGDCNATTCKYPAGLDHDGTARTMATWSTVSFTVGGVGLAAAGVLFLLEPRRKAVASAAAPLWRF